MEINDRAEIDAARRGMGIRPSGPLRMVSPGERIEGGWQDGQTVMRDYFVAEDDNGICYWIYKERPTASDESEARFFLHGLFG